MWPLLFELMLQGATWTRRPWLAWLLASPFILLVAWFAFAMFVSGIWLGGLFFGAIAIWLVVALSIGLRHKQDEPR